MVSRSRPRLAILLATSVLVLGTVNPPARAGFPSFFRRDRERSAGRSPLSWLHRRHRAPAAPGRCAPEPRDHRPEPPMTPEEFDRLLRAQRRTAFERSFYPGD